MVPCVCISVEVVDACVLESPMLKGAIMVLALDSSSPPLSSPINSLMMTLMNSCRCPLPVVSHSLLPFLCTYVFLGFTVAIRPILMCLSNVKPQSNNNNKVFRNLPLGMLTRMSRTQLANVTVDGLGLGRTRI